MDFIVLDTRNYDRSITTLGMPESSLISEIERLTRISKAGTTTTLISSAMMRRDH